MGALSHTENTGNTSKLDEINSLLDYVQEFGSAIARKVQEQHAPLFVPGSAWDDKLSRALRSPFQGQGDCIMGAVAALTKQQSLMVVGEMGTGKTLIGFLIPWVFMDAPRVLVMCPPHLAHKWVREIKCTVPDAEASVIDSLADALRVEQEAAEAESKGVPRYWVISTTRAKMEYSWKAAAKFREHTETVRVVNRKTKEVSFEEKTFTHAYCPSCGKLAMKPQTKEEKKEGLYIPLDGAILHERKGYCPACNGALWQADNTKTRRYAVGKYLKRHLPKRFFHFFVADEVHELKGSDTAQGNMLGTLAACARKTVCLTGTLLGGHASHLFHMAFRINASGMKSDGFDYNKVSKFVDAYGVKETVVREHCGTGRERSNRNSNGMSRSVKTDEKPGINPELFAHQLLDRAIFLHLEDVAAELPELTEDVIPVDMDPDARAAYRQLESTIKATMNQMLVRGDKRLLGTYLTNLLTYPDKPFGNPSINLDGYWYTPKDCDESVIYPKERALLDLVQSELAEGRKCLVYVNYVGNRGPGPRIKKILSNHGIVADTLAKEDGAPKKRESIIADKVDKGTQVLICNPDLVKTGLDLLEFPTIIYLQTGYNIFTLRQASRRSWRIGQDKPVKVVYLYYTGTMQERAVALIGRKLNASLAIEGKLTSAGLSGMNSGEDGALALAKSLQEGGIEGVESIWKQLKSAAKGATKAVKKALDTVNRNHTEEITPEEKAHAISETEISDHDRENHQHGCVEEETGTPAKEESEPAQNPDGELHREDSINQTPVLANGDAEFPKFVDTSQLSSEKLRTKKALKPRGTIEISDSWTTVDLVHFDGTRETVPALKVTLPGFEPFPVGDDDFAFYAHKTDHGKGRFWALCEGHTGLDCGPIDKNMMRACKKGLKKIVETVKDADGLRAHILKVKEQQKDRAEHLRAMEAQQETQNMTVQESTPAVDTGKSVNRRIRKARKTDNAWRMDITHIPGPEYDWTKRGWRKVSERSKQARVRRAALLLANAWKYDGATDPGSGYYWVKEYSYQRTLKDGTVRTINVRGHWRMKRNANNTDTMAMDTAMQKAA